MKKFILSIFSITLLLLCLLGCSQKEAKNPGEVVVNFFNALQKQDYASAKNYYSENLDNFPNFRNKIETISPLVAKELFDKLADFSYTIKKVEIDPNNPTKATAFVSIQSYDLGSAFEKIVLEYTKTDLEMTFDGAKSEEIVKKAEDVIVDDMKTIKKNFNQNVAITLTKEKETWLLDKISENKELVNVLSGNIINTIDKLSNTVSTQKK